MSNTHVYWDMSNTHADRPRSVWVGCSGPFVCSFVRSITQNKWSRVFQIGIVMTLGYPRNDVVWGFKGQRSRSQGQYVHFHTTTMLQRHSLARSHHQLSAACGDICCLFWLITAIWRGFEVWTLWVTSSLLHVAAMFAEISASKSVKSFVCF